MPEEVAEAERGREPSELAAPGSGGAGVACGEGVPVPEDECGASESHEEEVVGGEAGEVWHLQWTQQHQRWGPRGT